MVGTNHAMRWLGAFHELIAARNQRGKAAVIDCDRRCKAQNHCTAYGYYHCSPLHAHHRLVLLSPLQYARNDCGVDNVSYCWYYRPWPTDRCQERLPYMRPRTVSVLILIVLHSGSAPSRALDSYPLRSLPPVIVLTCKRAAWRLNRGNKLPRRGTNPYNRS